MQNGGVKGTIFIRSLLKKGPCLVVELSKCTFGCLQFIPECMTGCVSNKGKSVTVDYVLEEAKKRDCVSLEIIGPSAQRKDFLQKLALTNMNPQEK